MALAVVAGLVFGAWIYLLLFHGGFWRADQRLDGAAKTGDAPPVVAVIPARNEAASIGAAVASLLQQDYAGALAVIVVDDGSDDGTAEIARATASRLGAAKRLSVVAAPPLPPGWSGKLWAVHTGLAAVAPETRYVLLTDGDIVHAPHMVAQLVAKAEGGGAKGCLDLVSLMVKLHCQSFAERLLIPAFVFFFQKLFPFPWVNDRQRRVAGAAGGCMLVRRAALVRAGGIGAIKSALIDDCALAALLKASGPIWLGLTEASVSQRRYPRIGDVWRMVARTAYTHLRHRPELVLGTVIGMALLYLVPPLALVLGLATGAWPAAALGGGAYALMLIAYRPTWTLYRGADPALVLLPLAAALYTAMTVDSALQHWRGRGGAWKGRTYSAGGDGPARHNPHGAGHPEAATNRSEAERPTVTLAAAAIDFEARDHVHHVVEASGTSFLHGMRLLPEERREGMFAVYAFCREIDDIADEPAPVAEKITRLREWRREIQRVYEGRPQTLTGRALLPFVRTYGLERADFLALIDGMEMDAIEDIRAPSMSRLELYCDRVAGAVGRLSIRVFGATEPHALAVARHLGRALQLTNILRDLKEDAEHGRLYLPEELLAASNVKTREPHAVLAHPALPVVCAELARRARQEFDAAAAAMRKCARGPMRPAAAMGAVYRSYLAQLERRGWSELDKPVRLSQLRKLWIALRFGLI